MVRGTTSRRLAAARFLAVLGLAALLVPLLPIWAQEPPATPSGDGSARSTPAAQADPAKDIEKLKAEIRQLKAQLDELRSQNKAIMNHLTFAPEVEIQNEDYAQARSGFRTKLLRKG